MNTKNLIDKVNRATAEEQKLIAQILDAPESIKHSLSKVLSESKHKKSNQEILEASVNIIAEIGKEVSFSAEIAQKDYLEKLIAALTSKEVLTKLAPSDPLAAARLKGVLIKRDLLYQDGKPFSSEEVALLLNVTRQAIDKRRQKGQLLAVSLGRRGYLYPVWQFREGKVLSGLDRVLAKLKEFDPWTQLMFFQTGDLRLDNATPLENLKAGEIDRVVWAASCYGEQIAV
jgi:hypothetical protein